jgi:hypothetical protein
MKVSMSVLPSGLVGEKVELAGDVAIEGGVRGSSLRALGHLSDIGIGELDAAIFESDKGAEVERVSGHSDSFAREGWARHDSGP